MKEILKARIHAILFRLLWHTEPPYQCYWNHRALKAEKELAEVKLRLNALYKNLLND